jgi:dihydrofolate synthase/folylpolyglutamate synthase
VSYPDSVRYLYALGNELKAGAKFGLERMRTLLAELGNPEQGQRFVHVAGTNGKGSTCAAIASALRCSGQRTGLFVSPHLIEPTERIQIDGVPIQADDFASAFETVHVAAERLVREERIDAHPSYFETVTAMAFVVFRSRCDVAVIEVGLGGRLDATNVISPELTVITPVSFDHEAFLGNTIESIASEKAGILKRGVPLILAPQNTEAESVILARAEELGCPVTRVEYVSLAVDAFGSRFQCGSTEFEFPLSGEHQVMNAATAVMACRALGLDEGSIAAGLRETVWPGRLEYIRRAPDFVLDGAHNPAGAEALARYIRRFCAHRPVWMVYGAMRDKAVEEVTAQLFPLASHLILTAPDFPRALRPEVLAEVTGHPGCVITQNSGEAIEIAERAPAGVIVFFTGSLYLVGEVRKKLLATVNKR